MKIKLTDEEIKKYGLKKKYIKLCLDADKKPNKNTTK